MKNPETENNTKHFITCILCPRGCSVEISKSNGDYIVKGNRCKKGKGYAINEITNPTRTLTSTVKTSIKDFPRLPVRTDKEVPLKDIFQFMIEINNVIVTKRLKPGDIVIENIRNSGANLVATADMSQIDYSIT
jgi:CxxC motif-containing protein